MFTVCSYYLNVHPESQYLQYLCVIRSGSAIFRYFLRQKVTVIFEFLKFQISKFWPYGHKHPQEHSLWVWCLNSGPTYHYVSRICQKSTFFVCFFTKSQSENFRRLFLKKKKEIFYSDKICRSFRKVCVEWRANEQNLFLRIFEIFSKFFQNFFVMSLRDEPHGSIFEIFFFQKTTRHPRWVHTEDTLKVWSPHSVWWLHTTSSKKCERKKGMNFDGGGPSPSLS